MNSKDENKEVAHIKPFVSGIIGRSPKILDVVRLIEKIADSPICVLITGESGTGKELAARTIHANSSRLEKPFIDINCAAIPEGLLESELFGIEKGVATGVGKRVGKIETANRGTLFLDEVGDMSLPAQAKLLRVLQERKLERVGGRRAIDVDIRIIAATNKDLKSEIKKGSFREDLYYRLAAVHIKMPSLREMKEDIPLLAGHFLAGFGSEVRKGSMCFSSEAMDCLVNYGWPGNVRELENEVKRAALLAKDNVIEESDLSEHVRNMGGAGSNSAPASGDISQYSPTPEEEDKQSLLIAHIDEGARPLRGTLEEIEIQKIKEALERSGGNKQKASKILGLSRQGLMYKIKRYGLSGKSVKTFKAPKTSEGVKAAIIPELNEKESYIPKHLPEKITSAKSSLEGERKQVTALFADIHGFTELSEKLDTEEVHALVNRCYEIIVEEVHRYEGSVNQFTGNVAIAIFGAPVALEDHPYKAVNAALEIQKRIRKYADEIKEESGIDFRMRIGINTGLAVVSNVGNHPRMGYTAVGDAIVLASRLQNLAEPGKVIISENTQKVVRGYFLTRLLGEVQVKGKIEPLKTYEIIGTRSARTRIDVGNESGLTPFTGREKELSILRDCLTEVKEGHGQVVFIMGEPGVGKSRLLLEFKKLLTSENINWLEGRCISFGAPISYLPLIEILKRNFEIDKSDNEEEVIRKVEEGTLLLGNDLETVIPYFKYILSADPGEAAIASMDAQQRRIQIFEALGKIILRRSQIRPLVLVVEDLHWIDKTSEEFLVFLENSLPANPVLLILTYRTGYSHPFQERTYHNRMVLHNLSGEDSVRMAESILRTSVISDELRGLVSRRAEGNPFFIEELIKSLLENGIIIKGESGYTTDKNVCEIEAPGTIQDVIMARIDRLQENRKRALQVGSVIGREFSFNLLQKVSGDKELKDHLLALRNLELIQERGSFLDANYVFKHALTHEVAYSSLLVQKRKELHERVGNAIEELYPDRLEEFYGVLAHHFSRTDNLEKAFYYLAMAGKKSKEVFAKEEALDYFKQALERLDGMTVTETNVQRRIDILFDMENIYDATGKRDEQKEVLEGIIGFAKSINDERRLSDGYIRQAEFLSVMEEYQKAQEIGQAAVILKKKIEDKVGEGKALRGMGFVNWHVGNYDEALKYHQEALDVHRKLGNREAEGFELISLGEVYRKLGQYENALSYLQEALKVHRELGIIVGRHVSAFNTGSVYQDMGNYQACLEYYQECWKTVKEQRLSSLNTYANLLVPISIANAFWRLDNYRESLRYYREALSISRGLGDRFEEGNILSYMAAIYNILGDYQESINHYEEALKIYRELGDKISEGKALTLIGNIYRQNLNEYGRALSCYKESLEIKKEIDDDGEEIRGVLNSLGVVCWNLGAYEEALSHYGEALKICRKTGNTIGEGITLSGMGVVYLSMGRHEEALKCSQGALNMLKPAGNQRAEGYILNSIGNIYYEMGDYQTAWKYYQESLEIRKELGDKRNEAWVLHNIGRVYQSLENYKEAKKCYEEALSLAEELGEEELTGNSKNALSEIEGMN